MINKLHSTDNHFAFAKEFDCIVIGGGHAGTEAAHIVAKSGFSTLLVTMNLDTIGKMSCNPAIGGVGKGHIVREIDALGGMMGKTIDTVGIHFKMLNQSKGPAVWGPRAQADKQLYQNETKYQIESTQNLCIIQDSVESLIIENNSVKGIVTKRKCEYYTKYVILTTGTFLGGVIHVGNFQTRSGRMGEKSSDALVHFFGKYKFATSRLKTGTPPRVHANSIDYEKITDTRA